MNPPVPHRSAEEPRSPSDTVVQVVAEAKGVSPIDLPPLQDVVDGDALNAVIESFEGDPRGGLGSVTFTYGGYIVVVDGGGDVSVSEQGY
jgi:hypothetical protein